MSEENIKKLVALSLFFRDAKAGEIENSCYTNAARSALPRQVEFCGSQELRLARESFPLKIFSLLFHKLIL